MKNKNINSFNVYSISIWIARLLWLVPLSEISFLLWLIWVRTPDVPMVDEWFYVELLKRWDLGTLNLNYLVSFHNEHRIFIPRLISLLLIKMTGWNRQIAMTVNLAITICSGALLYDCIRRYSNTVSHISAAIAIFATVFFSPGPAYNYLMPFQIAFIMTIFGVALTTWALCLKKNFVSFIVAILGALIATLSSAAGLLVWPAFFFIFPLRYRRSWSFWAAWFLIGSSIFVLYFSSLPDAQTVPRHQFVLLDNIKFALAYLGAPFGYPSVNLSVIFGFVGIILGVMNVLVIGLVYGNLDPIIPCLGLGLFSIFTAAATSYGRTSLGMELALSPYRQIFSLLAWLSICITAVIGFFLKEDLSLRLQRQFNITAIINSLTWTILIIFAVPATRNAVATANFSLQVQQQSCVINWKDCPQQIQTIFTYGSPADPEYLKAHHLSIFRHPIH